MRAGAGARAVPAARDREFAAFAEFAGGLQMEIDTAAPVITRDEILIHAPIETVWAIQIDVAAWPSWQPDVDGVQVDGPLSVGSTFRWQTFGLDIASTVQELDAPRRIVWGGPAGGIVAVHVWDLLAREDGVLVRTEESWEGEQVRAQAATLQQALDRSLRSWLTNLKQAAERAANPA